jgi:hypothetical protein
MISTLLTSLLLTQPIGNLVLTKDATISGEYYEARTCSIFAGPCHYSGEVMTDGRTAVMVLSFKSGVYEGYSLSGLKAAVVVSSDENLSFENKRKSVLYLPEIDDQDKLATFTKMLKGNLRESIGEVISTKATVINLELGELSANVSIRSANETPIYEAETSNRECLACSMPGVLWYEPLVKGVDVSIATVEKHQLLDPSLGETWTRRDESAAFIGRFNW